MENSLETRRGQSEPPVDLSHVREMAGDDREVEEGLIDIFLSSTEEFIDSLSDALKSENDDDWQKHAHSLKGNALTVGAGGLVGLSKDAQEKAHAGVEEKRVIIDHIREEYGRIKNYLRAK